jgi:hypothetical protein
LIVATFTCAFLPITYCKKIKQASKCNFLLLPQRQTSLLRSFSTTSSTYQHNNIVKIDANITSTRWLMVMMLKLELIMLF